MSRKIGFIRGVFRMITPNHCHLIREATKIVDELIICIDSDELVKSKSQFLNEKERKEILSSINGVSGVYIFNSEEHILDIIKSRKRLGIRDDLFYFKGGDYAPKDLPEAEALKELGVTICCLSHGNGRHTSQILNDYLDQAGKKKC